MVKVYIPIIIWSFQKFNSMKLRIRLDEFRIPYDVSEDDNRFAVKVQVWILFQQDLLLFDWKTLCYG